MSTGPHPFSNLKISDRHSLNCVDCQQCLTPVSAQRESSCPGFCSLKQKSTIFVLQLGLHKLAAFDNICLVLQLHKLVVFRFVGFSYFAKKPKSCTSSKHISLPFCQINPDLDSGKYLVRCSCIQQCTCIALEFRNSKHMPNSATQFEQVFSAV